MLNIALKATFKKQKYALLMLHIVDREMLNIESDRLLLKIQTVNVCLNMLNIILNASFSKFFHKLKFYFKLFIHF